MSPLLTRCVLAALCIRTRLQLHYMSWQEGPRPGKSYFCMPRLVFCFFLFFLSLNLEHSSLLYREARLFWLLKRHFSDSDLTHLKLNTIASRTNHQSCCAALLLQGLSGAQPHPELCFYSFRFLFFYPAFHPVNLTFSLDLGIWGMVSVFERLLKE